MKIVHTFTTSDPVSRLARQMELHRRCILKLQNQAASTSTRTYSGSPR